MTSKFEKCVKSVKKKIKQGKIRKFYKKGKRRFRSNAFAICRSRLR